MCRGKLKGPHPAFAKGRDEIKEDIHIGIAMIHMVSIEVDSEMSLSWGPLSMKIWL